MFATEKIPLFPLSVVLMPNMAMPLHIFENRYKQMVRECLAHNHVFGMVYHNGRQMARIGCTAVIVRVLKTYDDGRMDIIVQGEHRFEIERVIEEKPYFEAFVSYFDDVFEPDASRLEGLATELRELFQEMFLAGGRKFDAKVFDNLDVKTLSFLAGFHEALTSEQKQEFLEMRNTEERMRKGIELVKKMIEVLKLNRNIDSIVQSNGHLPIRFKNGK